MAELRCVVAIPTRELFSGTIAYANIPSEEGYYGVLPQHESLVAANGVSGVLTLNLDADGKEQKQFLLYEGASQVFENKLTVLGRFGTEVERINVDEVREKAKAMREHIAQLEENEGDQASVEMRVSRKRLEWYETQIRYVETKGAA